jgi:hypothetical protein
VLALITSCLLAGVPAAHAAFTASSRGAFSASALKMSSPSASTTASCSPIGNSGKHRLDIAVQTYGSVARANAYALIVTDAAGNGIAVDLATSTGFSDGAAAGGWWTYSVEAQYKVPGSTNVWISKTASPAYIFC